MIKVAITGGIGSGKTTVCKHFYNLGIDIFDSDSYAKMQYDIPSIQEKVTDLFGDDLFKDGVLNVKKLTKVFFKDTKKLSELVKIITSGVFEEYYESMIKSTSPYIMFESAIIFNNGLNKGFDIVIGVIADEEERINRVIKRSNKTREEVKKIIDSQPSDNTIIDKCDYIIYNNGEDLEKQVIDIHNKILNS